FQEAVRYIGIAYRMGHPDQITAYNFFLVTIITGNYPKAVEALKSIQGSNLWKFYDGLNQYYTNDPGYKTALNDYIAGPGGSEDNEIAIAKFLVSDENKDDFESFTKSIKGEKWINHIILLKRAMAKFPNEFEPMFYYAKIMAYYKNYYEAYNTFRTIETKNIQLDALKQSSYNFYNAYTFDQLRMVIKANTVWQILMSDGDFYKRTAACYFYGKSLYYFGRKDEAVTVFKKGAEDGCGSKYSAFCNEFLKSAAPQISAPQTTVPAQ
ncbi:MAG: hypothetical protein MUC95_08395, partial [Spirochaetes bacterium]|nr:hypothetical protein [Spirochaetota bacterium]